MKKIILLFISFILCFLLCLNIKALNMDHVIGNPIAMPDYYIKVSDAQDNDLWIDLNNQISNSIQYLSPGDGVYSNLIITNDTNKPIRLTNIMPAGIVPTSASRGNQLWNEDDMKIVLTDWFYMSFKSGNNLDIEDNTIANFGNAKWSYVYNNTYQIVQTDIDIVCNNLIIMPNDTLSIYYDFTFSDEQDNRTRGMSFAVGYDVLFEHINTYQISTEVVNGTIDTNIDNIIEGSNRSINFKANDGYEISKVIIDGKELSNINNMNSYTFNNMNRNHSIKVEYVKQTITLPATINENTNKNSDVNINSNNKKIKNVIINNNKNNQAISKLPKTGNNYLTIISLLFMFSINGIVILKRH